MFIRLHEIEMGDTQHNDAALFFSSVLGLPVKMNEHTLTVFDSGLKKLDFNVSDHLPEGVVRISFLTDHLQSVIQMLEKSSVQYEGPFASHLGMLAVRFKAPNGVEIVVNTATDSSPEWLK